MPSTRTLVFQRLAMTIAALLLAGAATVGAHASSLIPAAPKAPSTEAAAEDLVRPRFARTEGKQILDRDGAPLLLKGISLGHWLLPEGYMMRFTGAETPRAINMVIEQLIGEPAAREFWRRFRDNYITQADIRFIKQAGFNSIRVPFHYNLFVLPTEPPIFVGPGYELLDRVVGWARDEGLYVVLDMHAAPGGQTGGVGDDSWGYPHLYDDAHSQDITIQLWQALALRYRDEPTVLGYDLLNEPIAHYVDMDRLNPKLEPLYRRLVAAIREVNPHHLIFLEGTRWATSFSVFGSPFADNIVYSFHKYWVDPTYDNIRDFADFRSAHNVPLWMGESGEASHDWIRDWRLILEEHNIGWAFWPYKSMDTTTAIVSVTRTPEWDAVIDYARQPLATLSRAVDQRPPREVVARALADYLENIKLENGTINHGYIAALGLNATNATVDRRADDRSANGDIAEGTVGAATLVPSAN